LVDHVLEYDVDVMLITETWLFNDDQVVIGECTPPGYAFLNFPRGSVTHGGGIGILFKKTLKLCSTPSGFNSVNFEHCLVTIKNSIQLVGIYRPPPSRVNGFKTAEYLEEFESFLEEICVNPLKTVLLGDFNVHAELPDQWDSKRMLETISNAGFQQFDNGPTHYLGHTLDLVVARSDDNLIQDVQVFSRIFPIHHFIVACNLMCEKPPPLKITSTSREFGKIDHKLLTDLLYERFHDFPRSDDPNFLTEQYENITLSVLDVVCPIITKERIVRHKLAWYNHTIHCARRVRRQLERKWKKSRSVEDQEAFTAQKVHVCTLINVAKTEYFSNKFTNANVKEMYATINGLLNKPAKILPVSDSNIDLANRFMNFFKNKIEKIRANVCLHHVTQIDPTVRNISFCEFRPLTSDEVENLINRLPSKSCLLDTFPSWLVKKNMQTLLPVILQIVNTSLTSGIFPDVLKQSIVTPIIKKSTMDPEVLKSYRPVANIKFLSKVIEKAASCQTTDHVDGNHLSDEYQSSYKRHHSTETALVKVQSDILQSLDNNKAVFLVLLDMSAAFDTVDHDIFLNRLNNRFGMGGAVQSWYKTYLKDRTTRVTVNHEFSVDHVLKYSLPQGSIIGPQGFTMYISPVGDVIRSYGISFHAYADDIQLYTEFNPKSDEDRQLVLNNLSSCISEVSRWLSIRTKQSFLSLQTVMFYHLCLMSLYSLVTLPFIHL